MPVTIDSAGAASALILGAHTSDNVSRTHSVSPNATNVVGIAALMMTGGVDLSGATFGCTWGGTAMDEYASIDWQTAHHHILKVYTMVGPPANSHSVIGSFSSAPTELVTRDLILASASYQGVASIGEAVIVNGAPPDDPSTHNAVEVDAVIDAYRSVTVHGVGGTNGFTAFNRITRAHKHAVGIGGGDLLLGDSPGANSLTSSATQLISTTLWGAVGIPLAPAVVLIDAALSLSFQMGSVVSILRQQTPDKHRYWPIDG